MGAKGKSRNNQVEILIVEDSPTQAQQLRYFLEQHDFQISLAGNGKEALALLAKHKQEIVISDIIMPEMDGYELCRQIKADERLKNIPVILVTRLSEPRDVIRGLECGADNFITKPYDEKFLLSRIQYLILNRELRKREDVQMAIQISFAGEKYNITSDRLQILNLLLSTYEVALQKNIELTTAHNELRRLNERLEELVKERTAALNERVKELKCLYGISTLTQMPESSLEEVVQNAVNLLPPGWQYPGVACARILLEGQEFKTENFRETVWRQSSPILLDGEQRAMVEVYYLEEKPECDEGPFLKEERKLIDDVARQLGGFIERKQALERLQTLNQVLKAIRKINQLITQESDRDRLIQDVCENLISARGYYSAWIALMDGSGKIVFCAEAGIGQDFLPLKEQLDRGELPICGRKALEQSGAVIAETPATSCTDCPLTHWYGDRSALTCRLEHGGTIYGLLTVSGPFSLVTDKEEIELLEEVTVDIALGLSNIKREEERKETEEALWESEKRFKELYDDAPVGYFEYDSQGRITRVNRTGLEMLGYTLEEMIGQPVWKFIVEKEEARQQILARLAGTLSTARSLERTYRKKDGATFPVLVENRVLRNSEARIIGMRSTIQDITERKQAEQAVRESEDRYRDLVENSQDLICTHDLQGNFLSLNPAAAKLLGCDQSATLKMNVRDILAPEVRDQFPSYLDTIRRDGIAKGLMLVQTATGERRILEYNNTLRTEGVASPIVRAINHDVTERRRAEQALRESEERFRELYDHAPVGYHEYDREGRITRVNRTDLEMLGYSAEEMIGQYIWKLNVGEELVRQQVLEKLAGLRPPGQDREHTYKRKDGSILSVLIEDRLIRDENGRIRGIRCTIQDITERKGAEEALKESEERFRALFEQAAVGVAQIETETGRFLRINQRYCEIVGYTSQEMQNFSFHDITHPEDLQADLDNVKLLIEGKTREFSMEKRYYHKNGSIVWVNLTLSPLWVTGEKTDYHIAVVQDITERKRAEEALRKREQEIRVIAENVPALFSYVDLEGRYRFVNKRYEEWFGIPRTEVIGKHCRQVLGEAAYDLIKGHMGEALSGHRVHYEEALPYASGGTRYVSADYVPDADDRGEVKGFFVLVTDITERKRGEQEMAALQEQLRQSQKMEAIGQLAGGIAHDFNNLLTIIKGYSQLSLMELREEDPLKENLKEVGKAAEQAARLTRQILAFSRRQMMEMKVLDLNTILKDLDKMLRRVIGEDIKLVTLLAGDLGSVRTDSGQVEQVIMNLAVNARDAMPHGGKLTIETANVELDEAYARNHIAVKPGHYVMLAVSDTGVGMAPEVRDRVFEPFFTTKEKSKGTGLGLSTVYGIVKQSGGNIWVYSEPDHGTTFKIYLPRVYEAPEELKEEGVRERTHRGGETILLVEDEAEVRKLAARILERQGYTVLEARDGEEALLLCEHKKEPIHLVLTDVVMPQMGGPQLVEQLKHVRQDFKVLYMSGYTDNSITHQGVLERGMNYIQKPFTIDGLTRKVREVLDK
jgi:two-component system cell cycle sensor histidine kinase/response regulator CckA